MEGKGTFIYADKRKYVGEFKQNKMEGQGTTYDPSGQIMYEGEWQANKMHGKGKSYSRDGD